MDTIYFISFAEGDFRDHFTLPPHFPLSYHLEATEELNWSWKSVYELDCDHYLND